MEPKTKIFFAVGMLAFVLVVLLLFSVPVRDDSDKGITVVTNDQRYNETHATSNITAGTSAVPSERESTGSFFLDFLRDHFVEIGLLILLYWLFKPLWRSIKRDLLL